MWQEMAKFQGFTDKETFTQIPDSFFRQLLNDIVDADELKVTLYAIWRIKHMEGRVRFLRKEDFAALVPDPGPALEKTAARGTLIRALPRATSRGVQKDNVPEGGAAALYFLNSPRGRAAAESFAKGQWSPGAALPRGTPPPERPNIFKLYEENIGPLIPLLADALKDAEQTYSEAWVAEAIEIAVTRNKRNWRYVEAILKRWKNEGKNERKNQQRTGTSSDQHKKSEFEEYLKRD
jgi:DNA replication protein